MNIFLLDTNPIKCAEYHCDKHIVKMPIEYAQLLSSALHHFGYDAPYAETHKNHPCAIWARKHKGNYEKLWKIADAVGKEYTHRYGKVHKSHKLLLDGIIPETIDTGETTIINSPLPNCTTFKGNYPELNLVDLYRMYYLRDKAHILSYKNREKPDWLNDYTELYLDESVVEPKKKRRTKSDICQELGVPELEKLKLEDLLKLSMLDNTKTVSISIPKGRLKAPFINECKTIHAEVDWNKLTIKDLTAFLKYIS